MVSQKEYGSLGQGLRDLHEKVGASARRIDHGEGKKVPGRPFGFRFRELRNLGQVSFVRGEHRPFNEMTDDFGGRVVDSSGLPYPLGGSAKGVHLPSLQRHPDS